MSRSILISNVLFLTLVLAFFSCKKDKSLDNDKPQIPKTYYLSKVLGPWHNIDFVYDDNHRLVEYIYEINNDNNYKNIIDYNAEGLLIKVTHFHYDSLLGYDDYSYNEKNKVEKLEVYSRPDNELYKVVNYEYNDKGWIINKKNYNEDGSFGYSRSYSYDEKGNVIKNVDDSDDISTIQYKYSDVKAPLSSLELPAAFIEGFNFFDQISIVNFYEEMNYFGSLRTSTNEVNDQQFIVKSTDEVNKTIDFEYVYE